MDIRSVEIAMGIAPESIFFIKDKSRKYVSCNRGLVRMCGVRDVTDILGRGTQDFFCEELVARYDSLDQHIYNGLTLLDRIDFLHDSESKPVWTLYSRTPVHLESNEIGVMGISKKLPCFRNSDYVYQRLYIATEWIAQNLDRELKVQNIAKLCNCSISQIQRDFVSVLGVSPLLYQAKLRLQHAKDKLRVGHSLASIAIDCGFSEQSGLSRFFKKQTGMTLSVYKKRETFIN